MPAQAPIHERELLFRMKNGEEPAFEQLYRLYSPRLYGNLLKLVKQEAIAQELLQDVFIRVWDKRAAIDPENSFRAYLFRIAENLVIDFFRKAARDRKLAAGLASAATALSYGMEELLYYKESNARLHLAIRQLPPQRRQVFTLCKLEGKSYQEVSLLLGISTATVSDHIVKASRAIREQLLLSDKTFLLLFLSAIITDAGPPA